MDDIIYDFVISQNDDKGEQVRFQVKIFRETEWLHLRKYYLTFHGEWMPTKDGITIPMEISTSLNLFRGLVETLSLSESKDLLSSHLVEVFKDIYPDEGIPR